ncbi:MAG: glycosyltransferase family 2 protein [Bacteroidales bacterium]|nr:glycosyltransferase family 2 protein [Candidatus Cryptobacteroides onthequi]
MAQPTISVIVPAYNAEQYLHRCIDSILAQTFKDFELLLIDDGSKDNSGVICDEYAAKDERVRVFHKENGGVSSARNTGLEKAEGTWITFCDADDTVNPSWLAIFADYFEESCDLICQGFDCKKTVFNHGAHPHIRDGRYIYGINGAGSVTDILPSLFSNHLINFLWIKAFKSDLIKEHNLAFDTTLRDGEDFIFICQYLTNCCSIRSSDRVGYHYAVPDWANKYQQNFEKEIHIGEQAYDSLRKIYEKSPDNELVRFYREDLVSKYILEFKNNKTSQHYCLKQLRRILKIDFLHSQLFLPTRLVIRFDCTYLLSRIVLSMHQYLKCK